jgi:hypothetical protein
MIGDLLIRIIDLEGCIDDRMEESSQPIIRLPASP